MALKRKIERTVVPPAAVDTPANTETVEAEKPTVYESKPEAAPAPEAPKAAAPAKPLDVTLVLTKNPTFVAVRVVRQFILFNDGNKMRREVITPGKPVTVRITQ